MLFFKKADRVNKIKSTEIANEKSLNNASKIKNARDAYKKAAHIFKGIFKIATMISDFDLRLSFFGNKIKSSADNLSQMFSHVASSSEEISTSTNLIVNTNSELNDAIEYISQDAEVLKINTEKSNQILENMKSENNEMIVFSKDMENSVDDLLKVIQRINDAVKGINKISDQTKILSLNASIEAAKAGVAGKGFAVVADEIRKLSETTKDLTSNIGTLLEDMNVASNMSKTSVEKTSASIERVSSSIENIFDAMKANTDSIENITKRINKVAYMSKEINDSLQESSAALESVNSDMQSLSQSAEELQNISGSINEISLSIGNIEDTVNTLAKASGEMVNSKLCGLSNEDFIETVENAINAHKAWLSNVKNMAKDMKISPIQTDEHKCGFGHFYYAVKPSSQKIRVLWDDVEGLHHSFHKTGDLVIGNIKKNDYNRAKNAVVEAEKLSGEIILKFEEMIKIANEMSNKGELVF